jgi:hypothetical protein
MDQPEQQVGVSGERVAPLRGGATRAGIEVPYRGALEEPAVRVAHWLGDVPATRVARPRLGPCTEQNDVAVPVTRRR